MAETGIFVGYSKAQHGFQANTNMTLSLPFLIALLAMLVFWAVGAYNRLVRLKSAIGRAFALVDLQLKERDALVRPLTDASQVYLAPESYLFDAVVAAHQQAQTAASMVRSHPAQAGAAQALDMAEQVLADSMEHMLSRLQDAAQAAPRLIADTQMPLQFQAWAEAEGRLGFSRQGYNDAVRVFNQAVMQFPAVLLARLFGFAPSAMLQSKRSFSASKFADLMPQDKR